MNRAMAEIFGFLNAVVAIAVIAVGFVIGNYASSLYHEPSYTVLGIALGVLLAAMFCGPIALLVAMYGELKRIRKI